jgi:hypothetical protein
MTNTPEGYTPEQWEQFKAHYERLRAEYAAAGGFSNWVRKREAARKASDARGYPVSPDAFSIRDARPDDERNGFADMVKEENSGGPPELWAYWFASEMAQRNGWDYATQSAAEAQIMRTFEAAADTLPLRQYPSTFRLPQGHPLPPKWREGCLMLKAELREWAKQHAPDLLGSALLAEQQTAPAEQTDRARWEAADAAGKRELVPELVAKHGSQQKAADAIGISREALGKRLRNPPATVAGGFPTSPFDPRKR